MHVGLNLACNLVRRPNWKQRIARATEQSVIPIHFEKDNVLVCSSIKQLYMPDSNMDPEATLLQQFFSLPLIVESGARNVGTRPGGFERLNPLFGSLKPNGSTHPLHKYNYRRSLTPFRSFQILWLRKCHPRSRVTQSGRSARVAEGCRAISTG